MEPFDYEKSDAELEQEAQRLIQQQARDTNNRIMLVAAMAFGLAIALFVCMFLIFTAASGVAK